MDQETVSDGRALAVTALISPNSSRTPLPPRSGSIPNSSLRR